MTAPATARRGRGQRTRRRLLLTARRLFLAHGYGPVHIADIADATGCTTGALGKHYPYKHLIGHEVAERLTALAVHRIRDAHPRDRSHLVTTLTKWARTVTSHPEWIWFELDLATTGPEHRAQHHDRRHRIHAALTELLTTTMEPCPGIELPTTAASLIAALVGLAIGPPDDATSDHQWIRTQIELVLPAPNDRTFPRTSTPIQES
ncbi:TetR/AcrR family transcriptional regulator [Nocardia sp. NPDC047038]|uniref:TetR/AcrR family transcriptional regulator n=1 Tax=Nocardia sp. NPDC047038 TaxID=3154338 RepID=UPI0033DBE108